MKNRAKYDLVLFVVLAVLAFLPMLQGWLKAIPVKPLNGVTVETERPSFDKETWLSGDFTKQEEAFASQHFGFREPVIRLYNQYLWSCYKKTYAHDVTGGKNGWLYYTQSVSDYYGHELPRWQPSVEEARRNFDREVKYLNWARTILKENGVDLMVFMAPEKARLYPEYLPEGKPDTTTFNACDHFAQRFDETRFPYIEMTHWFQQMKDTASYPLIPQTGGHWNFSSVYATDSLLRYMADLKGVELPEIRIGAWHESDKYAKEAETDLELLLNLAAPIRPRHELAPEAEVDIVNGSTTVKTKALFVGNSFFWRIAHYVPLEEVFDETEFWYYFSTAYSGDSLQTTTSVTELDLLEKLLNFDFVVWFTTGNQMTKGTAGFAQKAILHLCIDKDQLNETHNLLIDSLRHDEATLCRLGKPVSDSNYKQLLWSLADQCITDHPERYFPELASDTLPAIRNPRIKELVTIKAIKNDSAWIHNLADFQTVIQNTPLEQVLVMEAHNVIDGRPLLRDMPDPEAKRDRVLQLVSDMVEELKGKPELMRLIEEKAVKNERTVEEQTEFDARWVVNDKISRGVIAL